MRGKGLILVTLCLAALIINLDTTIVNVALPALVRQTGATTTDLQCVVDAYNLTFAALLLAAGSLSDRLGRKGMLLAGLGVFGAAGLAGSFAATVGHGPADRGSRGDGAGRGDDVPVHAVDFDHPGRLSGCDWDDRKRAASRVPGSDY
jgi:MFS family permease